MTIETAQARLRLAPELPSPAPLPDLAHVYEDQVRRPGDLHELYQLPPQAVPALECIASRVAVPTGAAARLLIEAALVRADLAGTGLTDAESRLDDAAAGARVSRRLSAAEADYVQGLRRPPGFARTLVTLPVRLIGRAAEIDVDAALAGDVAQAMAWEAAAMLAACTMREWALLTLLRAG